MAQILKNSEAHPAHIQALGRSLHYQLYECKKPLSKTRFLEKFGATSASRVKDSLGACDVLGIVREDKDQDCLAFCEGWDAIFASDAPRNALMLKINASMQKEAPSDRDGSLHALCSQILKFGVLDDAVRFSPLIDKWEKDGGSPIKDQGTQLNDAQRWMLYLGWVRRFGQNQYVPDFTRWLMAWHEHHQPTGRQSLKEAWERWCQDLPPLRDFDLDRLPEPVGVALNALERRGYCDFKSPADSPLTPVQWRLGKDTRTEREIEWKVMGGGA
jgi:hypothetical protein